MPWLPCIDDSQMWLPCQNPTQLKLSKLKKIGKWSGAVSQCSSLCEHMNVSSCTKNRMAQEEMAGIRWGLFCWCSNALYWHKAIAITVRVCPLSEVYCVTYCFVTKSWVMWLALTGIANLDFNRNHTSNLLSAFLADEVCMGCLPGRL